MKTTKRAFGDIGEDLAEKFLMKHGFEVVDRNYNKKWGELDIVARETLKKGFKYRFIEVKSVSCENIEMISHETLQKDTRPEEQVHVWKQKRLGKAIQTYIEEKKISHETPWQFDIVAVFIDKTNKKAKIRFVEGVVLG
ncbi:MAG: YraN family protein [Candidatus Yonathbacteria bacterium]|nr:YraN family protein [Candidatus Yonathbacteria bacterium]NTW47590.1 YraN family protein [Candidatus Yonathbacteria bacterium]